MTDNALNSLRRAGRKPGRSDSTFTPRGLIAAVAVETGGIDLDPACHTDSPAFRRAAYRWVASGDTYALYSPGTGGVCRRDPLGGLSAPWFGITWVNPPYSDLRPWLAKSLEPGPEMVLMLVPVRPHRRWWRDWAAQQNEIAWLDPFAFERHTNTFPAPLCIGCRGGYLLDAVLAAQPDDRKPITGRVSSGLDFGVVK